MSVLLMAAIALGAVAVYQPFLASGVLVVAFVTFCALARPDATTLVVVFILYANVVVVAVRFHGLPYIVGTLLPLPLIIPLTYHLVIRRQTVIVTSALPLIGLFVVIQTLSALFSSEPDVALKTLVVSLVEGIGLYFLITNLVRTRAMLRQVTWVLLFAGIFMGGLSVYQQVTKTFDKTYGGFAQVTGVGFTVETDRGAVRQRRLAGPLGEKNRYAQIMLMLVPLGLFRFWNERSFWWRTLAVVGTALAALGGILTFSRGGAVGFVLMLVLMAVMGYLRPRQLVMITVGLALLLVAVPQLRTRLVSLQSMAGLVSQDQRVRVEGSFRGRATEMLAAVRVFADHPILGVGPGRFKYYSAEYGNPGGLRALARGHSRGPQPVSGGRRGKRCPWSDLLSRDPVPDGARPGACPKTLPAKRPGHRQHGNRLHAGDCDLHDHGALPPLLVPTVLLAHVGPWGIGCLCRRSPKQDPSASGLAWNTST